MSIGEVVRGIMTSHSISIWSRPITFGAWVNPIQSLLNMAVIINTWESASKTLSTCKVCKRDTFKQSGSSSSITKLLHTSLFLLRVARRILGVWKRYRIIKNQHTKCRRYQNRRVSMATKRAVAVEYRDYGAENEAIIIMREINCAN